VAPKPRCTNEKLVSSNESLLQKLFAAGDAGAVEGFEAFLHANAVVHAPFGLSTTGVIAEAESWRKAKKVIPNLRHEFQTVVVDGAHEAARCVVTGTLQGELGELTAVGASFRVDQALFARVRDGKIEELWEIVDTASLEQQLKARP
jgi:predicted ester cyclase